MKKILFLSLALSLFVLPRTGNSVELNPDSLKMEQKKLHTPQGTWKYLTTNQGSKAILFLHGAGSSQRIWKKQYALSVDGYKKLFVDLLGYGMSDKPDSGYSLINWIEGINAIIDQEKIREVCIVAHSNGVIIAKEFYRTCPNKVSNLILLDGMLKQMIQPPMLEWMKSTLERSDYEAFMKNNIERMPTQGLSEADAEILKTDAVNTPKSVTRAEFDMVSDPATWRELTIRCPVTIVHAKNPMWDEAYVAWLPSIAPDHDLIQWGDAGHFIPLQFPDRLNRLIAEKILER